MLSTSKLGCSLPSAASLGHPVHQLLIPSSRYCSTLSCHTPMPRRHQEQQQQQHKYHHLCHTLQHNHRSPPTQPPLPAAITRPLPSRLLNSYRAILLRCFIPWPPRRPSLHLYSPCIGVRAKLTTCLKVPQVLDRSGFQVIGSSEISGAPRRPCDFASMQGACAAN